jgi:TonB-like protein
MKSMFVVALLVVAGGSWLTAQDTLSAARDLYASAAYEDALSALGRVDGADTPDVARQIEEYRAFCLFALGRTKEAESVAESLIREQPLATLEAADTSPRLERMFSDVRKRLLPSLIREQFRTARAEVDHKSFTAAERPLTEARLMIAEAEKLGVKDDGLSDLSVLVDGFLQLIKSSAEPRPAPAEAVVASAVNTASAPPPSARTNGAPPPSGARPAPARPTARQAGGQASTPPAHSASAAAAVPTYTIDDAGVSPPVTIEQRLPGMPVELQTIARSLKKTGMLDVVIDESGHVADATIRQSLNATYDAIVLRSTNRWRYEPATKGGVAVRFAKTIVLIP